MNKNSWKGAWGAVLFAFAPALSAQTLFYNLGTLSGGTGSLAHAVSRDGLFVAGQSDFDTFSRAFRWTSGGGMQNLGVLPLGFSSVAKALSSNGSVVVGFGDPYAFRWTQAGGMVSLGALPNGTSSTANGVNGDGSVIVGQCVTTSGVRAFRWTQGGGMTDLGTITPNGAYATANGVSLDGSVAVGWSLNPDGQHAFRWTSQGGMADLGVGTATGVNDDGSVVVGTNGQAFRWSASTGIQALGGEAAFATNSNGSIVVGTGNQRAFIWSAATGALDLNEYLPTQGVNLAGWKLISATSVSSDGRTLAGRGTFNGQPRGWAVTGLKLSTSDWVQWGGNGHWYRVIYVAQGVSWTEADVIARQQGGHLATFSSAAENEFAFSLADDPRYFVNEPSTGYVLGPWIGLKQATGAQEPGGGWGWVTGESLSYTRWFANQPDNNQAKEHVGCYIQRPETPGPFWNDQYDGTRPRGVPQLTSLIVESPYPPSSWVYWPTTGHWYKPVSSPAGVRWTDAQAQAAMEGGYLATPTSNAENDFVYNLLASDRYRRPDSTNVSYISGWLGLWQPENAPEPSGGWLWSSLEADAYRNWTNGEPNNFLDVEDFANYRYPIGTSQSGWNDFPNAGYPDEYVPSFVIERDTAPIAGNPAISSVPAWMTFFRGSVSAGNLTALFDLDQRVLELRKGIVVTQGEAPINTTVTLVAPWAAASVAQLNLTLRASSSSVQMTTEVFDYDAFSWVTVDQRLTPVSDTTVSLPLSNPTRYIKSETRELRARLSFKPIGPVTQSDWRIQMNWFKLDITP